MAKKLKEAPEERYDALAPAALENWMVASMQQWMTPWLSFWAQSPWFAALEDANVCKPKGGQKTSAPVNIFEPWLQAAPFFAAPWLFFPSATGGGVDVSDAAADPRAARERSLLNKTPLPASPAQSEAIAKPRLRVVGGADAEKPATPIASPSASAAPASKAKPAPKAAAKPAAQPKSAPKSKTPRKKAEASKPDDLTVIKGIGPKLAGILNDLGIKRYDQIAVLKVKDLEAFDDKLGTFKGRWRRDDWVAQAKRLTKR